MASPHAKSAPGLRAAVTVFAVAVGITIAGWHLMWFLTDDAYISFRYVSNWMLGYGLTWNPPPFQPVEGYSNFLWVVLLGLVWAVTGIAPPDSANGLSLGLGLISLGLAAVWIWRGLEGMAPRPRSALFAVTLLALVTNRTFLTWLSSGLETALMNVLVLWWVFEAVRVGRVGAERLPRLCLAAALVALTRPDGMLFWASAAALSVLVGRFGRPARRPLRTGLLAVAALLLPLLHLLWRRVTYDEWLPNTYYAKVIAPWPTMGLRFLASFVIEHAVWVWLLAIAVAGGLWLRRGGLRGVRQEWMAWAVPALAVATLIAHVGYFVLVVGGDHFEYRILSHLVPLLLVALIFALRSTGWRPRSQLAVVSAFWLFGLAIPWVHWWHSHRLETRQETFWMRVPIADSFPPPVRSLVAVWDDLQAEMIVHLVGVRHQEHKIFHRYQVVTHPPRARGAEISWDDRHVLLAATVGLAGWTLPNVAVIDAIGLNDRVIARAPVEVKEGQRRAQAHDRRGSREYLQCYLPDLLYHRPTEQELGHPLLGDVVPGSLSRVELKPRARALTDEKIRDCETRTWY